LNSPNYYLALTVILLSISLAGPLVVLSGAPGEVCAFWRLLLSSIIVFPFWLRDPRFSTVQLIGGLALAFHFILWMNSLFLVPVGVSTTLVVLYPAWSVIIDRFLLHERVDWRQVVGISGGLSGIIMLFWKSFRGSLNILGLTYSLMASLLASVYFSIGRILRRDGFGLSSYVFPVYLSSTLTVLAYDLVMRDDILSYPPVTYAYFVLLALIPMIGGHTLLNYLLKYKSAGKVTLVALGEPVGASLISMLLINQYLDLGEWLAMIIVIMSLIIGLSDKASP
jgi:drug/metabolite transporter (DMT)-like permease